MLRLFSVAQVDGAVLRQALQVPGLDFEDSVTSAAAQAAGCHFMVTRDPKGFRDSRIPAMNPAEVLPLLR